MVIVTQRLPFGITFIYSINGPEWIHQRESIESWKSGRRTQCFCRFTIAIRRPDRGNTAVAFGKRSGGVPPGNVASPDFSTATGPESGNVIARAEMTRSEGDGVGPRIGEDCHSRLRYCQYNVPLNTTPASPPSTRIRITSCLGRTHARVWMAHRRKRGRVLTAIRASYGSCLLFDPCAA